MRAEPGLSTPPPASVAPHDPPFDDRVEPAPALPPPPVVEQHDAGDPSAVAALVAVVAATAAVGVALEAGATWHAVTSDWTTFLAFVAVTFGLQLASVEVYGHGAYSFAGSGMLAIGFAFGTGPAMVVGLLLGFTNWLRRRGPIHRTVFDMAQWALAAGLGTILYRALAGTDPAVLTRLGAALLAGALFLALNVGLLTAAMSLSERSRPLALWKERFRWMTPYGLAAGPLAAALVLAYQRVGVTGLFAFGLPPAFMMVSVRQYVSRTRESVEEVRATNEALQRANSALEERNDDLRELLDFAGGLAARAHDRSALVPFVENALSKLTHTSVSLSNDVAARGGVVLQAGGNEIGSVLFGGPVADAARWSRLRDAILPHVATALESAQLVAEVRTRHLSTIAALSKSMEAKDYYTGGHTERVADVALAIAMRLGFEGTDLDAIEIGALLHDIGKIGVPEPVLHKPEALDADEWEVMKKHPVISDYILSEIDLHPFVRQIARSSHERIDGTGYPDGLVGEDIPLPARIVLVADAFDALTSDRPYRRARHIPAALEELRLHAGTQFCERCVATLEDVWREEPHVLGAGHLRAVQTGGLS